MTGELGMREKQIVVPDGMLKAVERLNYGGFSPSTAHEVIEAALLWLAENPIVPTHGQAKSMSRRFALGSSLEPDQATCVAVGWQHEMFYAPEQK
jgi:hypothetical protein